MKVSINGTAREFPEGVSVAQVLAQVQAPERGIAVAKNDCVVRRAAFASEAVNDGDRIEIIKAVAGG